MDQRTMLDGPAAAWLPRDAANNNRRLIRVRWLVGALILLMTAFSVHALNLPLSEPYLYGLGVLVLTYNGLLAVLTRRASNPDPKQTVQSIQRILFVQVNLDWLSMAVFVHLTGGITSPAIVLFIIHVMLVTMLVPARRPMCCWQWRWCSSSRCWRMHRYCRTTWLCRAWMEICTVIVSLLPPR
jgi:hypothetical protein